MILSIGRRSPSNTSGSTLKAMAVLSSRHNFNHLQIKSRLSRKWGTVIGKSALFKSHLSIIKGTVQICKKDTNELTIARQWSWYKCLEMNERKGDWIKAWGLELWSPEPTPWTWSSMSATPAGQRQEGPWKFMGQVAWYTQQPMTRDKAEDEMDTQGCPPATICVS